MPTAPLELWTQIRQRFDAGSPPADSRWRVDRTDREIYALRSQLNLPEAGKFLMAGTIGSGKSTELLHLAEARKLRNLVVHFDLYQHLQEVISDPAALATLDPWELIALIGLAVCRAASALPQGLTTIPVAEFEDAWRALLPEDEARKLKIGELLKTLTVTASMLADGGAVLATLASVGGALDWKIRIGRRKKSAVDQDPKVRRLVNAVVAIIEAAAAVDRGRPVLFLLDGLDRLGNEHEERARILLVKSTLWRRLPCHMVMLAPFALRHSPLFADVDAGLQPLTFLNERVLDEETPDDPSRLGPGIRFFRDLFAARVADLAEPGALLTDELLVRFAWHSGGRARDFVTFIHQAAGFAYLAEAPAITEDMVDKAIDKRRRILGTGLYQPDYELLKQVRRAPHAPLPRHPSVDVMLKTARLLPYRNDPEWFFPHPLLLRYLDRK